MLGSAREEVFDLHLTQLDRKHAVFETVAEEDVRERGREHGAKAIVFKGPNGMLSTRTTAEVASSQQNRCTLGGGLIQFEFGVVRTVIVETPIKE